MAKNENANAVETDETEESSWFDDYTDPSEDEFQIHEYDLTVAPSDFNVQTLFHFIKKGAVKIPGFQRNYVWDIGRASKLIESLILGLPVPQIFLYEEGRNKFLVIDGQQRLMSIYYFIKQRFPRKEKRAELRTIFEEHGQIPDDILGNDTYFTNFKLSLPEKLPDQPNKFNRLNYNSLGEYQSNFDLRPIRNVIVKQNSPQNDDSAVYEIFNRLNSGGVNLHPQEIRTSMYHSDFYDMLYRINAAPGWRKILNRSEPDIHMKDIETLLRGFALLVDGDHYAPSLTRFLNRFSKECRTHTDEQNKYFAELFHSFLRAAQNLPANTFFNKKNRRFNIALYEAVFAVTCEKPFQEHQVLKGILNSKKIQTLENDPQFLAATQRDTTGAANVKQRLARAREIVGTL
jgi:uncharacterized protein with ParB-like and HNH nuclease domain